MANPEDKKAGGPAGGQSGETDASAGPDTQVAPGDPDYPKYKVRFGGPLMPNPRTVSGPHTLTLLTPYSQVQIALTRNPTDPGIPDLSITITELLKNK